MIALGQYEKLGNNRETEEREMIKPSEINPPHVMKKKQLDKDHENQKITQDDEVLEEIEEGKDNFVFDEAQFDMDGKEYFIIEYFTGDIYKGELLGENRHGFGMFKYKKTGEKVLGIW